jgi:hypothetical protein
MTKRQRPWNLIRFPQRNNPHIIVRPAGPAWLVSRGDHAWAHGDKSSALDDASWLAKNTGLAIRVLATATGSALRCSDTQWRFR